MSEKNWITEMKGMNLPNRLTLLRIALVPFYLVCLWYSKTVPGLSWAALGLFAVASLTDLFDGKIARKYHLITNFGKFMDPIADKLLTHPAFIMMLALGRLNVLSCILFISREFVVAGIRLLAAERGIVIAAGMSGKVKTVLQMVLVILLTVNLPALEMVSRIVEIGAVVMTLVSMIEYAVKNRSVFSEEE